MEGKDSLAAAAVDRFCLALGSVAGDIALIQGASGVVIAGGLGYRIRETLLASGFADRFAAKGRFSGMMANLPVKLIVHPQPGLYGAAAAFAREHL
jgi:glucokinase